MRRSVCVLLTMMSMAWGNTVFAQSAMVTYYYDGCGNRVERTIGFSKSLEDGDLAAESDGKGWLASVEDDFGGFSLSLYPNPTYGKFSLTFSEEIPSPLQAEICTVGGAVVERRKVENLTEEFDLSERTAGIYVLRLTSGKETRTWKIIKKN